MKLPKLDFGLKCVNKSFPSPETATSVAGKWPLKGWPNEKNQKRRETWGNKHWNESIARDMLERSELYLNQRRPPLLRRRTKKPAGKWLREKRRDRLKLSKRSKEEKLQMAATPSPSVAGKRTRNEWRRAEVGCRWEGRREWARERKVGRKEMLMMYLYIYIFFLFRENYNLLP